MRALRASTTIVGKRTGRGAKIKLAPRANDVLLARAGEVKLDLPCLMRSLGMNDDATPIDASVGKLSEKENEENEMRNLNAREHQPSGADVEATSKRVESRENACDEQPHGAGASLLVLRDTSSEKRALVSENSMIVNVSKSERELSKSRGCEIAQTGQATPRGDDCEIDPELDKQLEIAAEELMRELHEECDRRERARCDRRERAKASSGGLPRSSEGQNENVKEEQVVLGGREFKTLFDPGATLSFAGPRVAELDKDRLKEYNSVI